MQLPSLRRIIQEAEQMPWGYGAAYFDPIDMIRVAYPVPLNLLVRWGRDLWWLMARYRSGTADDALHMAYIKGLHASGLEPYLQHLPECLEGKPNYMKEPSEPGPIEETLTYPCTCGLDEKLDTIF